MEKNLSLAEVEAALRDLSAADWKIIKIMARKYAYGLIHLSPDDLVSEAYMALFTRGRVFPRDARPVNVVINAMHSEASNCREREMDGAIDHHVDVTTLAQSMDDDDDGCLAVIPSTNVTPERVVASRQLMSAIHLLVADDQELQDLVAAWSLEVRGQEAADFLEWDIKRYEAARKRLVRRLDTIKKE